MNYFNENFENQNFDQNPRGRGRRGFPGRGGFPGFGGFGPDRMGPGGRGGFGPDFGADFGGDRGERRRGHRGERDEHRDEHRGDCGDGRRGDRAEGRERGERGRRPGFGPGFGPGFAGPMGPGFGPGFGFGGPMGPGRGRGGRGPGRGRKGDVRNAILALLAEQPMNGYQIITAISEKSEGLWSPSAGSVYPALGLLTDEGLITEVEVEGKKVNALTEQGSAYVEQHADEVAAPWDKVARPHQGFLDIRPEVGQLAMAVQQVVMSGDQAQIEAVRGILDQAKKDIYRLLAGETPASESGADTE